MKIHLEPIVPKMRSLNQAYYKNLIERAKQDTIKGIQADFQATVATWEHKPKFGITRKGDDWHVSTKDDVYSYVNEGTRAHAIQPRHAKRLVFFRNGFQAKTKVNWIGSGAGRRANRGLTFALLVIHPGTKPRNFSKRIKEKWQKYWAQALQSAIRKAAGR